MSNIQNILGIARTALLAQQKAIDVTGRNIANANTEGYTRQRITFSNLNSNYFSAGITGADVQRIYDRYLEAQINNAIQTSSRWESQQGVLERIEILFDESSSLGLSQSLNEFWNAWQDLANNPSGQIERNLVVSKSQNLVGMFNELSHNLSQIQRDTNAYIKDTVAEINHLTGQIAQLNGQIKQAELEGRDSNSLRDSRDQLLKSLSELIDVNSFEKEDGTLSVSVASGQPLIENTRMMRLETAAGADPLQDDIVWVDSQGNEIDITDNIAGGKLKGWLDVRDTIIPDYISHLDTLAGSIITEVNTLHAGGLALDGTQNDFFTGSTASDMAVNTIILNDPGKIAAAGPADGLPGGNSVALAIADLQFAGTMNGGQANFGQYYSSLLGRMGDDLQTANTHWSHQYAVTENLYAYRESISGVSLDEEMINLIKYQHAFEAAAQLINTADEMLETVVNMI